MKAKGLPVLFRADREDGRLWVTAVFPTEAATDDGDRFVIYQHIGQHGAGTRGWYNLTRAATPAEYAPLLAELRGIYETSIPALDDPIVPLRVVRRFSRHYDRARRASVQGLKG